LLIAFPRPIRSAVGIALCQGSPLTCIYLFSLPKGSLSRTGGVSTDISHLFHLKVSKTSPRPKRQGFAPAAAGGVNLAAVSQKKLAGRGGVCPWPAPPPPRFALPAIGSVLIFGSQIRISTYHISERAQNILQR